MKKVNLLKTSDVVEFFSTKTALATALHLKKPAVSRWGENLNWANTCKAADVITNGEVSAAIAKAQSMVASVNAQNKSNNHKQGS